MNDYDLNSLNRLLKASAQDLIENCKEYFGENAEYDSKGRYVFIDNGAKLLAVAHLDTVGGSTWQNVGTTEKPKWTHSKTAIPEPTYYASKSDIKIVSIQLDDRLGVWIITDVLPKLGMEYDILLTTDEELGQSTAAAFDTKKKYNWVFEFDRRGYGNVVMYQYHTKELERILNGVGYDVEIGTFSDISSLDHLGCSAFNFGCGYNLEHTDRCYTTISRVTLCIAMFEDFYTGYKDTHFVHEDFAWGGQHHTSKRPTGETCKICGTDVAVWLGYCDHCYADEGNWHKINDDVTRCSVCGIVFSKEDLFNGMCIDCLDECEDDELDDYEKCIICGSIYHYKDMFLDDSKKEEYICKECAKLEDT